MDTKKVGIGIVGVGAVLAATGLALSTVSGNMLAQANTGSGKCGHTYYAEQQPAGTHQFGPNQTNIKDKDAAFKRLQTKMKACEGDPLFTETVVSYDKSGVNIDAPQTEAAAKVILDNRAKWTPVTKGFFANVEDYWVAYDNHTYETLGMKLNGKNKMPSLVKLQSKVVVGDALFVKMKDGTVLEFRIICDLQPVGHAFKHVPLPPKETPPTTPPGNHKPCPPTPGNEPTGGPHHWDAVKCRWVKGAQPTDTMRDGGTAGAKQQVQDNSTSGSDVGSTKDGNGNPVPEPSQAPTGTTAGGSTTGGTTTGGGTGTSPGGTTTDGTGTTTNTGGGATGDTGQGGTGNNTLPPPPP